MTRLLLLIFFLPALTGFTITGKFLPQKTVTIHVQKGQITIDRITVYADGLAKEIQQRLWRSYMTSGKMVQEIHLEMAADTPAELQKEVLYAIQQAQEKTLTVLSLHKHKKRFENIGHNKQEKIKKQFPVLFQQEYSKP